MPNFSMSSSYPGLNYFGTMFTLNQPHPMVETLLLPHFGFISTDSYLILPERFAFNNHILFNALEIHNQGGSHIYWFDYSTVASWSDVQQTYLNPFSSSLPVYWPNLTTYYSPNPEYFRVVPFSTDFDWDQWYLAATSSPPMGEAFIYGNDTTSASASNLMTGVPTDNQNNAMTGESDLRLDTNDAGSTSANDTDRDNMWVDSLFSDFVDDPTFFP